MALLAGIKNRNLAPSETFYLREKTLFIQNPKSVAPAPTGAIAYFNYPEQMVLVGAQCSIGTIASGMTTFNVDVRNASGSMLTGTMSMLTKSQQVVPGTIHATNYSLAISEVGQIVLNSSNNENAFNLFVSLLFRPLVGKETRL